MITLTVIAIANKKVSVFYIIYLFWCDELLKSVFDVLKYVFKKNQIEIPKAYISNMRGRLFFLMIYFVFIVVFFGVVIDNKTSDLVFLNFEVLFFKNLLFNFSLLSFLLREIYLYTSNQQYVNAHSVMSRGVITLHLSIILGIFIWALFTIKFQSLKDYATIFSIVPFLVFKMFFEVLEIKHKTDLIKNL
jgi:hypothetical protein